MSSTRESELIAGCLRGEARAWDELFSLHYAATGRFVFQISPEFSREDVDEICQESFLAVINNLGSFRRTSQLQTWIFRIAANKARDHRERQLAAKRGGGRETVSLDSEIPGTDAVIDPPSPKPGPDVLLIQAERAAQVGAALEQLDVPCREVIELRYFGDLSYEEISAELDLNPKTVSSRLSKCLDRLEQIMNKIFSRSGSAAVSVQ